MKKKTMLGFLLVARVDPENTIRRVARRRRVSWWERIKVENGRNQ
jgi:hypothetical protein